MVFRQPDGEPHSGWKILELAGIPFVIEPSFLIFLGIIFLLGIQSWGYHPSQAGLFIFIVFFSLLAHEGGHALVSRLFGLNPIAVSLVMFGGNTWHPATTHGRSLLITLAGPAGSLVLVALSWLVGLYVPNVLVQPAALFIMRQFFFLNLVWLIFNLLPVYPLDGGQVVYHALGFFGMRDALAIRTTAWLSLVICVPLALWALVNHFFMMLVFIGFFFAQNLRIAKGAR
jgi:Zn-dependent protease